jgi:TonB family protein
MDSARAWLAERRADDPQRFATWLAASMAGHLVFAFAVVLAPETAPARLPEVLRINLVAALPTAARRPPARQTPASPPAKRPPARPEPKQIVLPKQAPELAPKRGSRPKPPPINYEDALSQLRAELGEVAPPVTRPDRDAPPVEVDAPFLSAVVIVDPKLAAWQKGVKAHLRRCWINPPEFLNRSLSTGVEVQLTATGELIGAPKVTRPSGDPYFDDNTLRAISSCAPLPAPRRAGLAAGTVAFSFHSEER